MTRAATKRNFLLYPSKHILWLLPGVALWGLCYLLPLCASVFTSFRGGFANYVRLSQDSYFSMALQNTLLFYGLTIGIVFILGVLSAHLLFWRRPLRAFAWLLLLPMFLPSSSIAALWRVLFGSNSALVRALQPNDASWRYLALTLLFLWKNTGAAIFLLLHGLTAIDAEVFQAAQVDGANPAVMLFQIELPSIRKVLLFALLYLLMNELHIFREAYLLYGSYPTQNLFFVQHYIQNHFMRLNDGLLSGASVVFSVIILGTYCLAWCLQRRRDGGEA